MKPVFIIIGVLAVILLAVFIFISPPIFSKNDYTPKPASEIAPLDRAEFARLMQQVDSDSASEKKQVLKRVIEVLRIGVAEDVGLLAIEAATRNFQPPNSRWLKFGGLLIELTYPKPFESYVDKVVEVYPRLGLSARPAALALLVKIGTRKAMEAFVSLVKTHGWPQSAGHCLMLLQKAPRDGDLLFPAFIDGSIPTIDPADSYMLLLKYGERDMLPLDKLIPHTDRALAQLENYLKTVRKFQDSDAEKWDQADEYGLPRASAGIMLDALSYFHTPEAIAALVNALALRDSRLQMFAAMSLLRRGKAEVVPAAVWEKIASDSECRELLFRLLKTENRLDLFPEDWKKQPLLAESEMINWLAYPAELGSPPDHIELARRVTNEASDPDELVEVFLFRFKMDPPHWAAESGWMAGIAGPYRVKDYPTIQSYGYTFSSFEPWDKYTPEEHVDQIMELLSDWRESQANSNGSD